MGITAIAVVVEVTASAQLSSLFSDDRVSNVVEPTSVDEEGGCMQL